MNFVYPNFLWAFFLLAIPIIIHLFNFRRYKTIYFSRVEFLEEVIEDSKSGTKLKHLLVLLSRLFAISALVLAFAQPYIPTNQGESTENLTSIYIDNSLSMQALGQDGDLLNEIKNKAIDLVASLDDNEKINLITSDLLSIHQRFYVKSDVIEMIKSIDFSARSTTLSTVIDLQADILSDNEDSGNKRLFLFSDFQKATNNIGAINLPEIPTYFYNATPEAQENVYIDSVWFSSPVHRLSTPTDLYFRIQNESNLDREDLNVTLSIGENQPGRKRISIPANSYVIDKITYTDRTPGIKQGKLSIKTSQLYFDDEFFFTYKIKESVKILILKQKDQHEKYLQQLYQLDPFYQAEVRDIESVTPAELRGNELIILQNINKIPSGILAELASANEDGLSIVFIPGSDLDLNSFNTALQKFKLPRLGVMQSTEFGLNYFNDQDPLYAGVFTSKPKDYKFPLVFQHYPIANTTNQTSISLFGINATRPYFVYQNKTQGKIFLMASPIGISFTNFQNHPLFAATFLRIAETASAQHPLSLTIGSMQNFPLTSSPDEKKPIHLVNQAAQIDVIPQLISNGKSSAIGFSHLENMLNEAGFYELSNNADVAEVLGLNYSRSESKVEQYTEQEVKEEFSKVGWSNTVNFNLNQSGAIQLNDLKAKEYWRILLFLVFIFIGIEILLLKFWKG
jgi:hypothetical protein